MQADIFFTEKSNVNPESKTEVKEYFNAIKNAWPAQPIKLNRDFSLKDKLMAHAISEFVTSN